MISEQWPDGVQGSTHDSGLKGAPEQAPISTESRQAHGAANGLSMRNGYFLPVALKFMSGASDRRDTAIPLTLIIVISSLN
jgi:hypothetical protein